MGLGGGIARRGAFKGDVFVSAAVVFCAALLLLFVALPARRAAARNVLFLATLTACGTTLLGAVLALLSSSASPIVAGLGLVLLFGSAGLVSRFLERAFGVPPTRWFCGRFGIWLAQMFAFTPSAFVILRDGRQARLRRHPRRTDAGHLATSLGELFVVTPEVRSDWAAGTAVGLSLRDGGVAVVRAVLRTTSRRRCQAPPGCASGAAGGRHPGCSSILS